MDTKGRSRKSKSELEKRSGTNEERSLTVESTTIGDLTIIDLSKVCIVCNVNEDDIVDGKKMRNPIVKCSLCGKDCHSMVCCHIDNGRVSCNACRVNKPSLSKLISALSVNMSGQKRARNNVGRQMTSDDENEVDKDTDYAPPPGYMDSFKMASTFGNTTSYVYGTYPTYPIKRKKSFIDKESYKYRYMKLSPEKGDYYRESRFTAFKNFEMNIKRSLHYIQQRFSVNPVIGPLSDFVVGAYERITLEQARTEMLRPQDDLAEQVLKERPSMENLPTIILLVGSTTPNVQTLMKSIGSSVATKLHVSSGKVDLSVLYPPTISLRAESCTTFRSAVRSICVQFTQFVNIHNNNNNNDTDDQDANLDEYEDDEDNDNDNNQQSSLPKLKSKKKKGVPTMEDLVSCYEEKYHVPLLIKTVERQRSVSPSITNEQLGNTLITRVSPIITLENFESWNPQVVRDIIYLLNSYRSKVPFIIVFSISTSSEVVHTTLPFDITSLLKLKTFSMQSQTQVFEQFVYEVFVKSHTLSIGPQVYQYLYENYKNNHLSMEHLMIQLMYSINEHFMYQPLSFLCHEDFQTMFADKSIIDIDEMYAGKNQETNNDLKSKKPFKHQKGYYSEEEDQELTLSSSSSSSYSPMPSKSPSPLQVKMLSDDMESFSTSGASDNQFRFGSGQIQYPEDNESDNTDMSVEESNSDVDVPLYYKFSNSVHYNTSEEDVKIDELYNADMRVPLLYNGRLLGCADLTERHRILIAESNAVRSSARKSTGDSSSSSGTSILRSIPYWIEQLVAFKSMKPYFVEAYYTILQLIPLSLHNNSPITYSELLYHIANRDFSLLISLKNCLKKEKEDKIIECLENIITILSKIDVQKMPNLLRAANALKDKVSIESIPLFVNGFITDLNSIMELYKQQQRNQEQELNNNNNNTSSQSQQPNNNNTGNKENEIESTSSEEDKVQVKINKNWGKRKQRKERLNHLLKNTKSNDSIDAYSKLVEFISNIAHEYVYKELDKFPLHEIFYHNSTTKLKATYSLNFSNAVLSHIDRSSEILNCRCCPKDGTVQPTNEDVTIIYKLYSESGRLINLYDWFTSFCSIHRSTHTPELQSIFSKVTDIFQILGLIKRTNVRTDHVMKIIY